MSRCFGTPSNLSAKDYTNKRSRNEIFCDLRNKYRSTYVIYDVFSAIGNNTACVDNEGVITKYRSQSAMQEIAKAYQEWRVDISQSYVGQQYKNVFCPPYTPPSSNSDISNSYDTHSPMLTLASSGYTAQDWIVDSSGKYMNRYAEVYTDPSVLGILDHSGYFKSGKEILHTECPIRSDTRMEVIIGAELPAPVPTSIVMVFMPPAP